MDRGGPSVNCPAVVAQLVALAGVFASTRRCQGTLRMKLTRCRNCRNDAKSP